MDSCTRVVVVLTVIYVIRYSTFHCGYQLASAQTSSQSELPHLHDNELILNPNFQINSMVDDKKLSEENLIKGDDEHDVDVDVDGDGDGDGDGSESLGDKKRKNKNFGSFWSQIEAEIFLLEMFNLTKDRLNEFETPQNLVNDRELNKCSKFNMSLDNTLNKLNQLIEVTSLENSYSQLMSKSYDNSKNKIKSNNLNSMLTKHLKKSSMISPKKRQQTIESYGALSDSVVFYFDCLASSEHNQLAPLREDLLPMSEYMRKIGSIIQKQQTNNFKNKNFDFSKLMATEKDLEKILNESNNNKKLTKRLSLFFNELRNRMSGFVEESLDLIG